MKKFLIVIISFLTLLFLTFIILGFFVKEANFTVTTTVNQPIEKTFNLFNDSTKKKEWLTSIKSITPLTETTHKVGNSNKIIVDNHGQDFEMIETITHFEPNKKIGLKFEVDGMLKTDDYTFISKGNTTEITSKISCKGQTFFTKATFPLFTKVFQKENQHYLDNFKTFAEKN